MSLYGALSSGVSGVNAFSSEMAIRADNISNVSTIGYKGGVADFSTLVSAIGGNNTNYASGGVTARYRALIDTPGTILSSSSASDISVNGTGFFVVNTKSDGSGDSLYTRAGSFHNDSKGNYVNPAGYTLMGWALDNEGRLPGEAGNLDATPNSLLSSLTPVNVKSITGSASGTTTISLGINLKETQKVLQGSGETISFGTAARANYNIGSNDVISPENNGGNILNVGDSLILTPTNLGTSYSFVFGGIAQSNDISGGILGATTPQSNFSGATDGDNFTITVGGVPSTYIYKSSNPISSKGEFNNLQTLVTAININSELTSRVVNDGAGVRLVVAPSDANQAMTFSDVAGTFVTALNLADTAIAPLGDRFASLGGLSKLINASSGLSSNITNPIKGSKLQFYAVDPLGQLRVEALGSGTAPAPVSTPSSVLTEFGLNPVDGTLFGPAYDPTNVSRNMSAKGVGAHFTRNVQVYDAFGTGHNVQVSFLKTAINTWAVEIYAQDPSELVSSRIDGQLASGNLVFNGDGSLRSVDTSLTSAIEISWANEAAQSKVTFNWGTPGEIQGTVGAASIGLTDGLRQVDADYNVDFADQNGIPSGLLTGVSFDDSGFVIASFSNGSTRKVFQIPVAQFANSNGLENRGGNAYAETTQSGNFNLKSPGAGGAGKIAPGALEQSNVDLADELTSIIKTQRNYQSASKIIKVTDSMLEELNRIIA
ncbi:MAG: flagellar hook-basal body complex protein [Alphaproteobacteria bacterium]